MSKDRQYPRSKEIESVTGSEYEVSYLSYDSGTTEDITAAFAGLNKAVDQYSGKVYANHRMGFSPSNAGGTNISGRYGMTHSDYEAWRPNERTSFADIKQTILHADMCYQRHGLIKNVIDLMGDFASQGIRLVHPNKRIEKFFQNWFRKVRGVERSERFLNNLYRLGNVVIRIQNAKINTKAKETLFKARATPDMEVTPLKITKNEIPWKYTFLHPATVEVVGGALASFSGEPEYAVKMPQHLVRIIKSPRNAAEKKLVAKLPAEIRAAAKTHKAIPLPADKTRVYHYKKDDWQEWANPIIASIALDISLYEKLKLADRAALDGAISNIRIFKLGNLEHKIVPTAVAAQKLATILESNVEAGTLDLIWGPDIELVESKTTVHQFLGQGKYEPTLIAIYAGLGIPPTLTGTFGAGGTTNNFISLKTLTQRLKYGRDILVAFWNEQIRMVQEAMGFRFPARVEFDLMNLGDEASDKALLIQLADRSLISDELLQHYFGSDPEMERIRLNNEQRERDREVRVTKSGPFHDPQFEEAAKKLFIQSGVVTPGQLGIKLESVPKGEQPALKMRVPPGGLGGSKGPTAKKKGVPGQGRPRNSKDTKPRKTKIFVPKTKATIAIWARAAQEVIADIINPILLEKFEKKNMRSLNLEQFDEAEDIRFGVLCNLNPLGEITQKSIYSALERGTPEVAIATYREWTNQVSEELDRTLNANERKNIQSYVYAAINGDEDNG